jgi:hypothetical protein
LGIMQGTGKSVDWENKTFFYPDSTITTATMENNLRNYSGSRMQESPRFNNDWLTIQQAKKLIDYYSGYPGSIFNSPGRTKMNEAIWKAKLHLTNFNTQRPITRKELAVLLMYCAKDFAKCRTDLFGKIVR